MLIKIKEEEEEEERRWLSQEQCLLHKCDDLCLILSTHIFLKKRSGVVVSACHLSTGEMATGGSLGLAGQPVEQSQ